MSKDHTITNGRLLLRPYQDDDAAALSAMTSRDEIYRTTYNIRRHFDEAHAKWWIRFNRNCRRTGTSYEYGIFEADTGTLVGNIGLVNVNSQCRHATLAYYVDPARWGEGIATGAGRLLLPYGFETLALNRIAAICMVHNAASRRVLEKLGFTFEGIARQELRKDEVYYDIAHYGLLRQDWETAAGSR